MKANSKSSVGLPDTSEVGNTTPLRTEDRQVVNPAGSAIKASPKPRMLIKSPASGANNDQSNQSAMGIVKPNSAHAASPAPGSGRGDLHPFERFLNWLHETASEGNAAAQVTLGELSLDGIGCVQDLPQAKFWFEQSANQGDAIARFKLGWIHEKEKGVSQDLEQAFQWYLAAAMQGNAYAQFALSCMYSDGQGVSKDSAQEFRWCQLAAKQGYASAQFNLAIMYEVGDGVAQDSGQSVYWYERVAAQGCTEAQQNLGRIYRLGRGVQQDFKKAAFWYLQAAQKEDAEAAFQLGWMYEKGQGFKRNFEQAADWYLRAAKRGHVSAQNTLGYLCQIGKGVKKDYKKAVSWYEPAARQGFSFAQYNLGCMYEKGKGVAQDWKEAAKWYEMAAVQGHKGSCLKLSILYKDGLGVNTDVALAAYWRITGDLRTGCGAIVCAEEIPVELIASIPAVLKKYPEFKEVRSLTLENVGFDAKYFSAISQLIRSDGTLEYISIISGTCDDKDPVIDLMVTELAAYLRENYTPLKSLHISGIDLDVQAKEQLDQALEQNKAIRELRRYLQNHWVANLNELPQKVVMQLLMPREVLMLLSEQLIVTNLRNGKSREFTRAAVDEFLISAILHSNVSQPGAV